MKCTHQYDEKQGNNNTRALSTKIVFFTCKKIDNKRRKKQRRGQTRVKKLKKLWLVMNAYTENDVIKMKKIRGSLGQRHYGPGTSLCLSHIV